MTTTNSAGVLAVMDAIQRRLDASFGAHSFPEYEQARNAVAELIEADKALSDYIPDETAIAKAFGVGAVLAFRRRAAALAALAGNGKEGGK